jgi:hypothetical protein
LGLDLNLPAAVDAAIGKARRQRNAVVHDKEIATGDDARSALSAAEELLSYLRSVLIAFEEDSESLMSRGERRFRSNEALES